MSTRPHEKIGLLAGSGRFPITFAAKARSLGLPVVCVGIHDAAPPELMGMVERFYWTGIARLGRMIRCFRREGVRRVVMAGKVKKSTMHASWRWLRHMPDWRTIRFWFFRKRKDNRDDSLLLGIIDEFAADGITFESALDLCPELLVNAGILTKRRPSRAEEADIAFGWELAKEMGRLDVGQSVAVRDRAVLAVEAIEGTDAAIRRAGGLCPTGGFAVIKVAKPDQDMRFDVPTVGPSTIQSMKAAGGKVLAIEADKTILIDEADTVRMADDAGIAIVAK